MQSDGGTLTLNGLGLRQATMLKVNVYVAALYVAHVSHDAQALLGSNTPKELILHFVHNVSDGCAIEVSASAPAFSHSRQGARMVGDQSASSPAACSVHHM